MPKKLILSLAMLTLAGCGKELHDDPLPPLSASLARFASCDELRDHTVDAYLEVLVNARHGARSGDAVPEASDEFGADGDASAPTDHSTTNIQEGGVDEPDFVKTDGTHVYVITPQGELIIVQSWPIADSEVVGRMPITGWPQSMFLKDDTLVVYSQIYNHRGTEPAGTAPQDFPALRNGYGTRISLIDLTDRSNPTLVRTVDLEGYNTNARRIGDDVYTVLSTWADMPWEMWELAWDDTLGLPEPDWEASDEEHRAARSETRAILRPLIEDMVYDLAIDEIIPRAFDAAPGETATGVALMNCTDIYRPEGLSRPSILSLVHLSLDEDASPELSATGLMSDGWTVYASQENLYISQTSGSWWSWGAQEELTTHIHQFSLQGGESTYEASGAIPGWLLNQFSMSEHDGHLRVATTDRGWGWGWEDPAESANNVFVLNKEGMELQTVGEVRGIAPGEQIFAARFLGDRGYLVTFEQIDPLFTLDLADPTDPQVVGELKIPGYSSYLHPIGDTHLLAVGMDGRDDGTLTGVAVNLFDISDFANPTLQDQVTFGTSWGWSDALWDHRAFTFHRDVLSIPFYTWESFPDGSWESFSGLVSVDVDVETGLFELGGVDHADLIAESECLYGVSATCGQDYWWATLRRSVVIEDNLLSISDYGIKATDLNDPTVEHARVLFWPALNP